MGCNKLRLDERGGVELAAKAKCGTPATCPTDGARPSDRQNLESLWTVPKEQLELKTKKSVRNEMLEMGVKSRQSSETDAHQVWQFFSSY